MEIKEKKIEYIKDDSMRIRGNVGDNCAIMGYPEGVMSTTGLTYNGDNYHLKLGLQESVSNTLAAPVAEISIQGEALIIHP